MKKQIYIANDHFDLILPSKGCLGIKVGRKTKAFKDGQSDNSATGHVLWQEFLLLQSILHIFAWLQIWKSEIDNQSFVVLTGDGMWTLFRSIDVKWLHYWETADVSCQIHCWRIGRNFIAPHQATGTFKFYRKSYFMRRYARAQVNQAWKPLKK